ncbi:hypothetical protein ERJ75_001487700 [Trypanosoma vivax]|nr:hypothetical protein ERJ75_001487700 [Trypanosoma vivax]
MLGCAPAGVCWLAVAATHARFGTPAELWRMLRAPLPLAVACLFALGGLAARTRDAPAGTHADDAVAEGPRPAVAIALPVHLRGRGRWEEAQMTEVAQATLLAVLWEQSRACWSTANAVQTQRRWCAVPLR